MLIKILLIVAVVAVSLALTRATGGARHQALRRIMLVLFIAAAAVSVLWPPLLTKVANLVGVGRGADLLLYALVIAFLTYISTSYRRMTQMSRDVTALARELTLLRARLDDPAPASQAPEGARTTPDEDDLHKSSTPGPQGLPRDSTSSAYDSQRD